jgi:hypothetical protein
MTRPSFTPGPWSIRRARDASGVIGITAPGVNNVIAECFSEIRAGGQRDLDVEANAQLVAAAPELVQVAIDVEWAGVEDAPEGGQVAGCPRCGALKRDGKHIDYCQLDAALRKAGVR